MDPADRDYLLGLAVEAYLWGSTLVQTGEFLRLAQSKGQPMNTIVNGPKIMSWAYAPCIDVLYSYAFLDVSSVPLVLSVPAMERRPYTFQFMDTFGNVFGYIGTRATGSKAGRYAITGADWTGSLPEGVTRFECPTEQMMVYVRTFIADEEDLPAANAACAMYALGPLAQYPAGLLPAVSTVVPLNEIFPILRFEHLGAAFFDVLGDRLSLKLPLEERNALKKFAPIGVGPRQHPAASGDPGLVDVLSEAVAIAQRRIDSSDFWTRVNGWEVIYGVTHVQKDTQVRAYTNRLGGGFHTASEALYFHCRTGPDGYPLNGTKRYALRFPSGGLPPVNAFWSLSLMDSKMIPVRNPIGRYAIAPHTKNLTFGRDGSLDIQIQSREPKDGPTNWLPSGTGEFFITLRLYVPKTEAINGTYKPPQVQLARTEGEPATAPATW